MSEVPKQVTRRYPLLGHRKDVCDPHIRDQCRHLEIVLGPIGLVMMQGVGKDLNKPVPHKV
ncbi:hypothetical protein A5715_01295 [Mycolicibacter heraklionensis]|nr:hypothetical protein A5715_01295 [Mycolicibacter heraklionensis]